MSIKHLLEGTDYYLGDLTNFKEIIAAVKALNQDGIETLEVYNPKGIEYRIHVDSEGRAFQIKLTQAVGSVGYEKGLLELQYGGMSEQEFSRYGDKIGMLTYQQVVERIKFCIDNKSAFYTVDGSTKLDSIKEKLNRIRKPFELLNKDQISVNVTLDSEFFKSGVKKVVLTQQDGRIDISENDRLVKSSTSISEVFQYVINGVKELPF